MKVRSPCQAGTFYARTANPLRAQIEECFTHELGPGEVPKVVEDGPRKLIGLICPHAGYVYSGPVAAHAYHRLALDGVPRTIVILGPNHVGYGSALAVMNEGVWRTPLGDVKIDADVANDIVRLSRIIDVNDLAHRYEHSIEVQLPFLQYLYDGRFKLVPICLLLQDLASSREVGRAIAEALEGKDAIIIASTDWTHYEPHERAVRKDLAALEAVKAMDEVRFYKALEAHRISACGYGPVAALITAAKGLGATKAEVLCYKTSGDVTGDYSSVVGYASASFER